MVWDTGASTESKVGRMGFTLTMENTALQQPEVQSQQLSLVLPHLWRAIWLGSLRMILSM